MACLIIENAPLHELLSRQIKEKKPSNPPLIKVRNNSIELRTTVSGASLGYQVNEESWKLYTKPFTARNASVKAKAIRYGWEESEVTKLNTLLSRFK